MLVSTSPLSQGEQRTPHCCAADGRRYRSQGYPVAASMTVMVICVLTVSKTQGGLERPGMHSLGHCEGVLSRGGRERGVEIA